MRPLINSYDPVLLDYVSRKNVPMSLWLDLYDKIEDSAKRARRALYLSYGFTIFIGSYVLFLFASVLVSGQLWALFPASAALSVVGAITPVLKIMYADLASLTRTKVKVAQAVSITISNRFYRKE